MAKFIKVPLAGVTGQPEILVDSSSIVSVIAGDVAGPGNVPATKTRILTNSGITGFQTLELTHTAALAPATIVGAINDAIKANPGGIISTVGSPVSVAQNPVAQSGAQGRTVVVTPAVQVSYSAANWS
jgi:hypothetical protein|tara:strand:+ start:340 stop:723 length:384 start_codon:yes stop_codon:yes gene_type:complete